MSIARGHTLEHIRQRRAAGLGKRRGRIPRIVQPDTIRVSYWKAIRSQFLDPAYKAIARVLPDLKALSTAAQRADAPGESSQAARTIERVSDDFVQAFRPRQAEAVARQFAERTSDFQAGQLGRQLRAALGVDVPLNAPTAQLLSDHVTENVRLISTIAPQYLGDVQRVVVDGVNAGRRWEDIAADMEQRYGVADSRAKLIARDQVGKFFGALNQVRQTGLGITGYTWRTMNDDRVREEHQDLEGEQFQWTDEPPDGPPGFAINCFPGDTPVGLLQARAVKLYRRRYRGQLTTLVTESGEPLRCTPNHPVLTGRGWVPAHLVEVGEHLFEAPDQGGLLAVHDPQRREPTIDEVFRAASALGLVHRVAGHLGWFHGDVSDEEIDVVAVDGRLGLELDPACSEGFCDDFLALANDSTLSESPAHEFLVGPRDATNRSMRRAGKILALIGRHPLVTDEHRIGAVAWLDAIADKLSADGRARDAEAFREFLHACASDVQGGDFRARVILGVARRAVMQAARCDAPSAEVLGEQIGIDAERAGRLREGHLLEQPRRVVQKLVGEDFDGHVFNLETTSGWYLARGLCVRNCRCFAEPDVEGLLDDLEAE